MIKSKPEKAYLWREDRGVVEATTGLQVQQLLLTCSKSFRTRCGKLLVTALNCEAAKARHAKKGK